MEQIERFPRVRAAVHDVAGLYQMGLAAGPSKLVVDERCGPEDLDESVVRAVHVADGDDPLDSDDVAGGGGGRRRRAAGAEGDGRKPGESEISHAAATTWMRHGLRSPSSYRLLPCSAPSPDRPPSPRR